MRKEVYFALEAYMQQCMKDSAHDKEHIYRVLNNAMAIAQGEQGVNYDILICACLLHDIGRPAQLENPALCHAAVGSQQAYDYLVSSGYPEDFARRIRDCIRTHRFRKSDPPVSLEAKILFDADKLDVVGAVGIALTLAYQGTVSAPMYSRNPDGTLSDGNGDTVPSFFREYHFKLKKLYDRFYTAKGAELAQKRRKAAEAFYCDLWEEISASCDDRMLNDVLENGSEL